MKELRQDSRSHITPAESVPSSPSAPLTEVLATPEKHRDQSSHSLISEQEEIRAGKVEEEITEEETEIEKKPAEKEREIVAEEKDEVENQTIEEELMNKNDTFEVISEIEVDEVNNSGVGLEKEERPHSKHYCNHSIKLLLMR